MRKLDDQVYVVKGSKIRPVKIIEIETKETMSGSGKISKWIRYKVKYLDESSTITGIFSENQVKDTKLEVAYDWLKKQDLNPAEVIQGFMQLQKKEQGCREN